MYNVIVSDRSIYINSNVHTGEVVKRGLNVVRTNFEILQLYKSGVEDMNPAIDPAPEPEILRRIFQKDMIPPDFREEWKRREVDLIRILNDAGIQTYPEMLWGIISRRVPHSTELPNVDAALSFLSATEGRLGYLYRPESRDAMWSLPWARLVAMENMGLRGAVYGSTFFTPASPLAWREMTTPTP